MNTKELFSFPNPVNEVAARVVAAGVLLLSLLTLATRRPWLLVPLAYGFIARALTGPTLSPLGQLATRVIAPRLPVAPKPVAGPPKRFAQALGAVVSTSAALLALVFGRARAAYALVALMVVFATLESTFGFCVGCKLFGVLMRIGLVPEDVCAECANIWDRPGLRDSPHAPSPGPSSDAL
ncbi:MAG TPA: DUF4395 domain-containing protein [Thermomicrobiales bacterium]|jgi:hypothetical protein